MRDDELVALQGTMTKETDGAWLVEFDDGEEGWVPKSLGDISPGGTVMVREWKAVQEGWPYD